MPAEAGDGALLGAGMAQRLSDVGSKDDQERRRSLPCNPRPALAVRFV
jgi:hypothetical protein